MYPRELRLTQSGDWRRVRRRGRCSAGRYARICVLAPVPESRFGFTTERGIGGAVLRNRARRRVSEAFKDVYSQAAAPRHVAVTARRDAADADFVELRRELAEQLGKMGIPVVPDGGISGA